MIIEHHRMKWLGVVFLGCVLAVGCTTRNPRKCLDGFCNDPAYPFCDLEGVLGGEPKECIAVACTAGEFAQCRGDTAAITCNATGNDYDLVQCQRGCDDASGGCRLCNPNETACTNGTVATCDAVGTIMSMETCALGCFEDQPRCREIDPSNNLAMYLDMVPNPPDVNLSNAAIDTGTGEVRIGMETVSVPSFLAANGSGGTIRVLVVNTLQVSGIVGAFSTVDLDRVSGPALAILARGDIVLEGRLVADGTAGGVKATGCVGGVAQYRETTVGAGVIQSISSGSGGGGHATAGAPGGNVNNFSSGGAGGVIAGTDALIPLRGGCPSGGFSDGASTSLYAAPGGGAIQLSSRTSIRVNGVVDLRGARGYAEQAGSNGAAVYGGGAGGGLLLEAPKVTLSQDARLIAKGGGGGALGQAPSSDDSALPEFGTACPGVYCGDGGNGAAPSIAASLGESIQYTSSTMETSQTGGGGGGGMGFLRINTPDRTYTKASTAVEAGALSTGTLATR